MTKHGERSEGSRNERRQRGTQKLIQIARIRAVFSPHSHGHTAKVCRWGWNGPAQSVHVYMRWMTAKWEASVIAGEKEVSSLAKKVHFSQANGEDYRCPEMCIFSRVRDPHQSAPDLCACVRIKRQPYVFAFSFFLFFFFFLIHFPTRSFSSSILSSHPQTPSSRLSLACLHSLFAISPRLF